MEDLDFDTPLIGESHRAAADALARFIDAGDGGAYLVCGPPGIGTSRTANEAADRSCRDEGDRFICRFALRRGQDAEVAAVGWLRDLLAEPFGIGGNRARWRRLVARVPKLSDQAGLPADRTRPAADTLADALRWIAGSLADDGRLVVLVDLDDGSVDDEAAGTLERIVGDPPARLHVLIATSEADLLFRRLYLAQAIDGRRVDPVDPDEAETAKWMAGEPALAALSEEGRAGVIARAGGWTLALTHYAREIRLAGAGGEALVRNLPPTLAERIVTLARTLEPIARRLVATLAVLNRTVDGESLAEMTGTDPSALRAALIASPACWLVASMQRPERPTSYRILHARYAEWIADALGEQHARARLTELAEAFRMRSDADSSRTDDLAAWADCLVRAGDKRAFAKGVESMVVRLHSLRQYELLFDVERKRLAIFREVGYARGEAAALHNLGEVYRAWRRHDRAMAHLKKAMALFRANGHGAGEAAALAAIGEIHLARGDNDRALVHFRMAQTLFADAGLPHREQAIGKKIEVLLAG